MDSLLGRHVKNPSDKILRKEIIIPASLKQAWDAWTTTEGVKSFFSSEAKIELAIGGAYEIYFILENPYGLKGSEDCRVLSFLPMEMLSFEWNAPPEFGELRGQHTRVILQFQELESSKVRVILSQLGWGRGEDWDRLYEYFDKAWGYVLNNLKKRFIQGPIDWSSKK